MAGYNIYESNTTPLSGCEYMEGFIMDVKVNKQMSIGEVLRINRMTAPIFMQYGMHCLGCPHATAESLEDAGAVHGIDVDALVDDLNKFLAEQA